MIKLNPRNANCKIFTFNENKIVSYGQSSETSCVTVSLVDGTKIKLYPKPSTSPERLIKLLDMVLNGKIEVANFNYNLMSFEIVSE